MKAELTERRDDDAAAAVLQAVLEALDGVTYLVDPAGMVLATGQPAPLPQRDDAPARERRCDFAVGACLFDGIAGDEVKAAYRRMHDAVLSGDRPFIAFEYRCDAPDVRRKLRMSVHPIALPGAPPALLYQSQTLSEVERPWMSLFEPSRIIAQLTADRGLPIVSMCSFCQRVAWPPRGQDVQTRWVEADEYYRFGGPTDVRTSHGVCEECDDLGGPTADEPRRVAVDG